MQKDPRVDYVSLPASVHFLVLCVARIEDHGVDHVLDSLAAIGRLLERTWVCFRKQACIPSDSLPIASRLSVTWGPFRSV